jgi:hypothetical protein
VPIGGIILGGFGVSVGHLVAALIRDDPSHLTGTPDPAA